MGSEATCLPSDRWSFILRHGLSVFHLWPSLGNGTRTTSVYHIPYDNILWSNAMAAKHGIMNLSHSHNNMLWSLAMAAEFTTCHGLHIFQLELKTTNQKPRLKNVWKPFSFKTVFSSVIIISPGYLGNWHHRSSSGSGRGVQSFGIVPTEGTLLHHLWSCTWEP